MDSLQVVDAFGEAWGNHDLDGCMAWCADDMVFESTAPPDGERAVGHDAIRAAWQPIFDDVTSQFDVEDTAVLDDRVVQRWKYSWSDGHVRGVDLFRVADDKVVEKFSYVKG